MHDFCRLRKIEQKIEMQEMWKFMKLAVIVSLAWTLITQNTIIPDGSLIIGNPGKVVCSVTDDEIDNIRENAVHYVKEGADYAKVI